MNQSKFNNLIWCDNLAELHEIELELLKRFVNICNQYHLHYYIIGGTLLGAVRYKGFIPWDDDIDVAVPREDYIRLLQLRNQIVDKDIGIQYYKDDPDLYFYPAKLINKKYCIQDARANEGYSHPWIDLLPLDGRPDGIFKYYPFKMKMNYYRALLAFCYIDRLRDIDRSVIQRVVIKIAKVIRPGRWIDPTKVKDKVDRLLTSNKIEECTWIGTCMGAYFFHEFVPKEYFGNASKAIFCGLDVNAPELVDLYLTHIYGDYLTPPDSEKLRQQHIGIENH